MRVNAFAPLAALQAFAALLRHDEGAVAATLSAMVGSISDNQLGGWYSYRMSKAALNMGLRNAAIEFGRRSNGPVGVAIHPGTTFTACRKKAQPTSCRLSTLSSPRIPASFSTGTVESCPGKRRSG